MLNNREHFLGKFFDWRTGEVSDQFLMFDNSLENTATAAFIKISESVLDSITSSQKARHCSEAEGAAGSLQKVEFRAAGN